MGSCCHTSCQSNWYAPMQTIKMTTHSQSFPPDQRILVDQVTTLTHPYLKKNNPQPKTDQKGADTVGIDLRWSRFGIIHLHLSVWMTDSHLFSPPEWSRGGSSSANSADYFRNYRPDDDTHSGTTGCSLNYSFRLFFLFFFFYSEAANHWLWPIC